MRSLIDGLHSRYNRNVIEQAAIAGALNPELTGNREQAEATAALVANRLDMIAEDTERGWQGFVTDEGGLRFERMVRGVKEVAAVDVALIGSADARHMDQMSLAFARSTPNRRFSPARMAGAKCRARVPFWIRSLRPVARACRCSDTRASVR